MKLTLIGHNERYTVEQSLLTFFPDEKPEYAAALPGEDALTITLEEKADACTAVACLTRGGIEQRYSFTEALSESDFAREGQRRHAVGAAFYGAAQPFLARPLPWGMLTGVRPDKPALSALLRGETKEAAARMLEERYFVSPARAFLAARTASCAARAASELDRKDIALYIGIPFCPTRCAYCSFVSVSVERSLKLLEPYTLALIEEIRAGGAMLSSLGLRVRAVYMGGGTPTTLSASELDRVLSALEQSVDLSHCAEITVEAGRPDTITDERLAVLASHGVGRVSVNPQSMQPSVLSAIGRVHSPGDIERSVTLVKKHGFAHMNMDLIAGLPEDDPAGFTDSLQRCIGFAPDNLTVHTLALKRGSRLLMEKRAIPTAEEVSEMLETAGGSLRDALYRPYYLYRQKYMSGSFENIGWCRGESECLYNILIMSELCSILSFGAGGSTKALLPGGIEVMRVFNPKYPEEYIARPEKMLANQSAFAEFYRRHGV